MPATKNLQVLIISQDVPWVHQCRQVLNQISWIDTQTTVVNVFPSQQDFQHGPAYDVILIDAEEIPAKHLQDMTKELMLYNPELAILFFVYSLEYLSMDILFELGAQDVIDRNTLSQGNHCVQRIYAAYLRACYRALHCGDVLLQRVKKHNEKLRRLAHLDYLTQLPNRLQFDKAIKKTVAHARRHRRLMAILIIDVDNFKTINDTLGHVVGDQLLRGIAKRLLKVIREEDIIARTGGDEFVVIVTEMNDYSAAGCVAEKMIRTLQPLFHLGEHDVHISVSIGLACYPIAGEDAQTLLEHADAALYRAKNCGRNHYQYYTSD